MRSRGWGVTVVSSFVLLACGGRSQRVTDNGAGGSDPMSVAGGGGAAGEPAGDAGALDAADAAGAAGANADGGATGSSYSSLIRSGTRRCESSDYCFGLECYAPATFQPTVCLARCDADVSCRPSELCLSAPLLEPTCYQRCNAPDDCYEGFNCYDFSGAGELVCLPTGWTDRRADLGYD
jgi:hypothetical protein